MSYVSNVSLLIPLEDGREASVIYKYVTDLEHDQESAVMAATEFFEHRIAVMMDDRISGAITISGEAVRDVPRKVRAKRGYDDVSTEPVNY